MLLDENNGIETQRLKGNTRIAMQNDFDGNVVGFQRLLCKNSACNYLLKTIYFYEGWEKRASEDDRVLLVTDDSISYYVCPRCRAKNYVIKQGEKILLEILSLKSGDHAGFLRAFESVQGH
ncbi:MAG: hypothetical protein NTZ51_08610 [Proteobacteria bacterium]|nr:hypothetical protein [Pseudomonadota bacterium]